jgi:hypothetical protein
MLFDETVLGVHRLAAVNVCQMIAESDWSRVGFGVWRAEGEDSSKGAVFMIAK